MDYFCATLVLQARVTKEGEKEMTLNIALLDEVMATINADQEHWEQGNWRCQIDSQIDPKGQEYPGIEWTTDEQGHKVMAVNCNTAFCFAGWAVQLGSKIDGEALPKWAANDSLWANEHDNGNDRDGDDQILADLRARRLLGLTLAEADALFDGTNTLLRLRSLVERFKEEARA